MGRGRGTAAQVAERDAAAGGPAPASRAELAHGFTADVDRLTAPGIGRGVVYYEALNVQRNALRWLKMLRKHGFIATPAAA